MIPGVGRYSTLISPRAGSLFHAVFQTTAVVCAGCLPSDAQAPPRKSFVHC